MTLNIFEAARQAPERPALLVGQTQLSYRQLADRVQRRRAELGAHLAAGRAVTLIGRSDLATLEIVYAAMSCGAPLFMVHPRSTPSELDALLGREKTPPLLTPLELAPPAAQSTVQNVPCEPAPDNESPLAVLFTSGTAGTPKGAVLSRRAFLASAAASARNLGWQERDRWLLGLPLAHVGGLSILVRCLLARRTVVLPEPIAAGARLTPESLVHCIDTQRVTLLSLVPTQLQQLLDAVGDAPAPPSLRAVLLGGAHAPDALLRRAAVSGWPILTTYGLTEACSQVATQPLGTTNDGSLGSGRIVAGTDARVAEGVLHVRGPTLFSGYHGDPGNALDKQGWFCTGDHARIDEDGYLHVLGRRTDLIVTGGENVYPVEVERSLERHPAVDAACVFGLPDEVWGQIVAVAIVSRDGVSLTQVRHHVETHLARHKRPRRIAFVDAFRTTPAGKLDREATAAAALVALVDLA